jgi:hypothetical protein
MIVIGEILAEADEAWSIDSPGRRECDWLLPWTKYEVHTN